MFQENADEVSFASTDSVLNNAPVLVDGCAAYLGKHFTKGIDQIYDLRSHRLWRVFPREFEERKDLTERLQSLLLVFNVHHF